MLIDTLKNIFASEQFYTLQAEALRCNEFFTPHSIQVARKAIETQFLSSPIAPTDPLARKAKVGIVCAGNIPMVGFADMFWSLACGAEVYLKPSRRDPMMLLFADLCHVVDRIPTDVDLILAMGSDQTMQAIAHHYPTTHLTLRGHRHSVAVLDGKETEAEMEGLADDIFLHSGMGCRSVSHIYVPDTYQISRLKFPPRDDLPRAWYENYRYQKAILTMKGEHFEDCQYYILLSDKHGQIPMVSYSRYSKIEDIVLNDNEIQCTVTHCGDNFIRRVEFGKAQFPAADDFANGDDVRNIIKNILYLQR